MSRASRTSGRTPVEQQAEGPRDQTRPITRPEWIGVLARARRDELEQTWAALGEQPSYRWLRSPEVGLVMIRGRAGGTGRPFNLGEMTVTRCMLQLASGATGLAYVQGRDRRRAELAALLDALLQEPRHVDRVLRLVIEPLRSSHLARRTAAARKAAATKVEFFTLVRGDDPL